MPSPSDTIVAIATPPGRGGIGVVRISGSRVRAIAHALCGIEPEPRRAQLTAFTGEDGNAIDRGLALFFAAPHSFTGEDVLELHAHGSPVALDTLVRRACELGARAARAGEFSERAFLNGKLDLNQAEAVADLIAARSDAQARAALRSLEGEFSRRADALASLIVRLRVEIEAAIDFSDEASESASKPVIARLFDEAARGLQALLDAARRAHGCPNRNHRRRRHPTGARRHRRGANFGRCDACDRDNVVRYRTRTAVRAVDQVLRRCGRSDRSRTRIVFPGAAFLHR
jgi:tRNA modification GTPase